MNLGCRLLCLSLAVFLVCREELGAQAQWEFSGNHLLDECQPNLPRGNPEYDWRRHRCMAYITGVSDGLAEMTRGTGGIVRAPCIPEGVTRGQALDIVVRYLDSQPEERHTGAGTVVAKALYSAFPCK